MALDLFLTIQGIAGETQDAAFASPRGMELLGFKFGGSKVGDHGPKHGKNKGKEGEAAEKKVPAAEKKMAELFSFSVEKFLDAGSPDLLKNYALTRAKELKPYPWAKLSARKPPAHTEGKPLIFFVLEFTSVYVVKYEIDLDTETNTPTEDIDFCFNSCVMTYTPQKESGEPDQQGRIGPMGWDFFLNQRKPKQ